MCMQRLPLGKQNRTQRRIEPELKCILWHMWPVWMTHIKEEEEKIQAIHIQQL